MVDIAVTGLTRVVPGIDVHMNSFFLHLSVLYLKSIINSLSTPGSKLAMVIDHHARELVVDIAVTRLTRVVPGIDVHMNSFFLPLSVLYLKCIINSLSTPGSKLAMVIDHQARELVVDIAVTGLTRVVPGIDCPMLFPLLY